MAKQKNVSEAGSSSTAAGTSEVEGHDPENPGIPQASLLSPIPEMASETVVTPAEKSSEGISTFSPQFVEAVSTFHHIIGQSMKDPLFSPKLITVASHYVGVELAEKIDVPQRTTIGGKSAEKAQRENDKAATVESGGGDELSKVDAPHDDEMIETLKDDGGSEGYEEDPDVAIVGDSKSADDITLA